MWQAFALGALLAVPVPLTVTLDGKALEFEGAEPQTVRGRVMVPIRGIFEALGAMVEFDPAAQKITARSGEGDFEMRLGDRVAKKSGAEILLDVPPIVRDGRTLVPLRFFSEALGAKVNFDKANRRIEIRSAPKSEPPPPPPSPSR